MTLHFNGAHRYFSVIIDYKLLPDLPLKTKLFHLVSKQTKGESSFHLSRSIPQEAGDLLACCYIQLSAKYQTSPRQ